MHHSKSIYEPSLSTTFSISINSMNDNSENYYDVIASTSDNTFSNDNHQATILTNTSNNNFKKYPTNHLVPRLGLNSPFHSKKISISRSNVVVKSPDVNASKKFKKNQRPQTVYFCSNNLYDNLPNYNNDNIKQKNQDINLPLQCSASDVLSKTFKYNLKYIDDSQSPISTSSSCNSPSVYSNPTIDNIKQNDSFYCQNLTNNPASNMSSNNYNKTEEKQLFSTTFPISEHKISENKIKYFKNNAEIEDLHNTNLKNSNYNPALFLSENSIYGNENGLKQTAEIQTSKSAISSTQAKLCTDVNKNNNNIKSNNKRDIQNEIGVEKQYYLPPKAIKKYTNNMNKNDKNPKDESIVYYRSMRLKNEPTRNSSRRFRLSDMFENFNRNYENKELSMDLSKDIITDKKEYEEKIKNVKMRSKSTHYRLTSPTKYDYFGLESNTSTPLTKAMAVELKRAELLAAARSEEKRLSVSNPSIVESVKNSTRRIRPFTLFEPKNTSNIPVLINSRRVYPDMAPIEEKFKFVSQWENKQNVNNYKSDNFVFSSMQALRLRRRPMSLAINNDKKTNDFSLLQKQLFNPCVSEITNLKSDKSQSSHDLKNENACRLIDIRPLRDQQKSDLCTNVFSNRRLEKQKKIELSNSSKTAKFITVSFLNSIFGRSKKSTATSGSKLITDKFQFTNFKENKKLEFSQNENLSNIMHQSLIVTSAQAATHPIFSNMSQSMIDNPRKIENSITTKTKLPKQLKKYPAQELNFYDVCFIQNQKFNLKLKFKY